MANKLKIIVIAGNVASASTKDDESSVPKEPQNKNSENRKRGSETASDIVDQDEDDRGRSWRFVPNV